MTTVFFHGLNTYDDDLMHVGPLTFGLMHAVWEREFARRNLPFIAVEKMGKGPPAEQAERSLDFLRGHEILKNQEELCFVGQSVGGLVARVLAVHPDFNHRVRKIITVGTPHLGAEVAELGLEFAERSPALNKIASLAGYDASKRSSVYSHFTRAALTEFNKRYPTQDQIKEFTMLCEVKAQDSFLLLRLISSRLKEKFPGDGFISSQSQKRGEVFGPFQLDHMEELGVFLHTSRLRRRRGEQEFNRMIDQIAELVSGQGS